MATSTPNGSTGTHQVANARLKPAAARLPMPPNSFVGREADVDAVVSLVESQGARLVTLTGSGGIGKTRLAVAVAHRLALTGADVAFLPLHALSTCDQVWVTIAEVAGVPVDKGVAVEDRVLRHLAQSDMVMVLDNLEHLPGIESVVTSLLGASDRLRLLCTGRRRLNLSAERVYPLNPLSPISAVSLFADRARAVDPSLRIDDTTTPLMLAICDRLEGLPLAVELAAARTDLLSLTALHDRLDRQMTLLTGGPADAPKRQQTMRDTIDWSYRLLGDRDQRLFRRLAVFVGGFSLDAARVVGNDGDDALDAVGRLLSAGLIWRIDGPAGDARFRLPFPVREYALEVLDANGELALTRDAHSRYFRELMEAAIPGYDGPDMARTSDRTEADLGNCRAAISWALERKDGNTAVRLSGAIWRIWWPRHRLETNAWVERVSEGRSWIVRSLEVAGPQPLEAVTEALMGASCLNSNLGRHDEGRAYATELLQRSVEEGYPYGEYWALHRLASDLHRHVETHGASAEQGLAAILAEGQRMMQRSIDLSPGLRDPENHEAMGRNALAHWLRDAGEFDQARVESRRTVALAKSCGNPFVVGFASLFASRLACDCGDMPQAVVHMADAAEAFVIWNNLTGVRYVMENTAEIAIAYRQPGVARTLLRGGTALPMDPPNESRLASLAADVARALNVEPDVVLAPGEPVLPIEDLVALVRSLGESIANGPRAETLDMAPLTARQLEVLGLIAAGLSNRSIADRLSISERTVDNHVLAILDRLGVDSRTAAATWAVRHGVA